MAMQQESSQASILDTADWEKTMEVFGRLTGSVLGGYVSEQLAFSLGLRVVSVIGGYYSGAFLGVATYMLVKELVADGG